MSEKNDVLVFKERAGKPGGGKGILIGEDKTFTLSTMQQDAVCFQLCGDRDDPSVSVSEKAYCVPANPMSDRGQAVCYALDQQGGKSNVGVMENVTPTILSDSHGTPHAVCYSVENHPNDSRVKIREDGTVQTLSARCGTGGAIPHAHSYVATQFAGYKETIPTLRASGGDLGGGSEGLIVYESLSNQNRSAVRQQPSRVVYRSRCIQRHAAGNREGTR